mgnify:CR=1 FL=1
MVAAFALSGSLACLISATAEQVGISWLHCRN